MVVIIVMIMIMVIVMIVMIIHYDSCPIITKLLLFRRMTPIFILSLLLSIQQKSNYALR